MPNPTPSQTSNRIGTVAAGCSPQSPGAVQNCPNSVNLELGVFFDGTGNNMFADMGERTIESEPTGSETNVARLFKLYPKTGTNPVRRRNYQIGIGSGEETKGTENPQSLVGSNKLIGGATGQGAKEKCFLAYQWVKEQVTQHVSVYGSRARVFVDVYGFSRGAMQARTFVNMINQSMKVHETPSEHFVNLSVRFLGIFDTVESLHARLDSEEQNTWLTNEDYVQCYHATAKHEHRFLFPLTLTQPGSRTTEREYVGVHADVGGGYGPGEQDKPNWLAFPPLIDVHRASRLAQVPFDPLPEHFKRDAALATEAHVHQSHSLVLLPNISREGRAQEIAWNTGLMPTVIMLGARAELAGKSTRKRMHARRLRLRTPMPNLRWEKP
jgi:uncharacterized protein (DUF2235 family)